jgi:hypothetical protein
MANAPAYSYVIVEEFVCSERYKNPGFLQDDVGEATPLAGCRKEFYGHKKPVQD